MIYPENFEKKIGFDTIKSLLSENCISNLGKDYVSKIKFSSNSKLLGRMHHQISEFRNIIDFDKTFPVSGYLDLRPELYRLKTKGSYLTVEGVLNLKKSLSVIREILNFFEKSENYKYVELKALTYIFTFPDEVFEEAKRIINDKGKIYDNASTKLAAIRINIGNKQRKIITETNKAFQTAKKNGYLAGDEITIRNGRAVIPVKATHKRAIKGFIHDESSSGQTVFIEPVTSFETNNEIIELENEERREIIRILTNYSDILRPDIANILNAYRFLGLIDFIRAKALLSKRLNASSPIIITNKRELILKKAIHPLLYLAHKKLGKEVIPLNLLLDENHRILIISGPNAGGKSVCLKTLGLLQYMFQCGLQIPASPNSELPLFDNLFIDIGDEQSLENDLSTYTSNLLNMKFFIKSANSKTLILIDEFGTGTEPQLGAAIAEATLEQLSHKMAYGLITTHYTNLKLAADKIPGLINGAMLFDTEKLKPLYIMKIGKPGSSFAFEIAKQIGFPANVLNSARKKSGGKHLYFDKMLQQIETDKIDIAAKRNELITKEIDLNALQEKYNKLLTKLKKEQKEIVRQAKIEALEILKQSNKDIEKTIKEIIEAKANKGKTKSLRLLLETKKTELEKQISTPDTSLTPKSDINFKKITDTKKYIVKPGDYVTIEEMDVIGKVLYVEGNEVLINVNDVKLNISLSKVNKTDKKPKTQTKLLSKSDITNDINNKISHFKLTIDLRGKRAEEALELLTRYIDDAILLNIKKVNILHGKGYGILREIIRNYLGTISEIKNFSDAPVEHGGAGITHVTFK